MATGVTLRLEGAGLDPAARIAQTIFADVERSCTRFDPGSDLMRANASGDSWTDVHPYCFAAIAEARNAHAMTGGLFDPRVLRTLLELGYDRTLPFESGVLDIQTPPNAAPTVASTAWSPGLDPGRPAVRIGPCPIDLGGIGKGLATRWASEQIRREHPSFLLEAGGDCYLAGDGPTGNGWQVAIEHPFGGENPAGVLQLRDTACATSSTRIRNWRVNGRPVHHLIDPRTGQPAAADLASVTVIDPDPATAEIWSKVLFLNGSASIATEAERRGVAAVWVNENGRLDASTAASDALVWTAA